MQLIFAAGVSTADQLSSTSGRGVGMDAVKEIIHANGGKLTLNSQRGHGTQFEIDIHVNSKKVSSAIQAA